MTARPPLSAAELSAMRARCEAATPGEWFWNSYSRVESAPMCQRNINEVELPHEEAGSPWAEDGNYPEPWRSLDKELNPTVCWVPPNHGDTAIGRHKADAILIAHARTDLPRLLDELERCLKLLERTTAACKAAADAIDPANEPQPVLQTYAGIGALADCVLAHEQAAAYLRAVRGE